MASWKKVIVSGSQAHLQGITASNLTNNTSTPTPQIVGYDPATGIFGYFNTSSVVTGTNAFVQNGNSFGTTAVLGTNDTQNLQFETSGSVRMTISSSGNVGIGTTTPTNTLQVGGTGISTTQLTASALPVLAQTRVLGIDANGNITQFDTASIAPPTSVDGVGVGQRLTMWSDNNTITTSSIVMNTDANPRYIVGFTNTASSPVFGGRLNVSGSGANEGIIVGSRVSTDVNSYGTYVFSDTEGPKIGFGSYTTGTTTPLSASWGQIGAYNQALRFEAFTTGSHALSGGILFSYSGSNRPDLKISASNGATLVGINTQTPTNTLEVGGGITAVNITASGNISSSAGLIGQTLTTIGNSTIGGNETITGNLTVGGDLTVNGDTTIINTSTLSVEDKFIVLGRSSGSQVPASEGGIIVEGAGGSGSAFLFNSGSGTGVSNRWGIATNVPTGSTNVTPTDFMVTVSSSNVNPAGNPFYGGSNGGYGNIYVNSADESIWIYS